MKLSINILNIVQVSVLSLMIALTGCGKKSDNSPLPLLPFHSPQCPELTLPAGATLMDSGSVWNEGQWQCYYLLKLEYDGNEPSYAMWIPPLDGGVQPVVVMTRPYDYIRWNGDSVPPFTAVTSNAGYVQQAYLFLFNGYGVLNVFERYYAGGSIQNDVDDTVAGLRFLAESGLADATKIGIWGGSWGGFEALYGAAYAADGGGAVPLAGVAFFPVSDFADEVDYIENPAGIIPNNIPDITDAMKRTTYETFFEPYLDRIKAASGWENWDGAALLAKLTTDFMVVHDEWDTLVPFEQSTYLSDNSPLITPLYFYQETPRDLNVIPYGWGHGELREYSLDETPPPAEGITFGISNTLASAYLFTRLRPSNYSFRLIGYDATALNDFIGYIRDYKCVHSRESMMWAAELLSDCTDSEMLMMEMNTSTMLPGADVIAQAFSDANWGSTTYGTASSVRTALSGGLPACP